MLGTRVTVSINAAGGTALVNARKHIVNEIERLEQVFTIYDDSSELARWRRGALAAPGAELAELLGLATELSDRTGGAFHPAAERLVARWRQAESEGKPPEADELAELARVVGRNPLEPSFVSLNAVAKGYIVDSAVDVATKMPGVRGIVVNAGGDLVHWGQVPTIVGIEDPLRRFDNVGPLTRVRLQNAALATSGSERRGFRVGDVRYGHVIDPRTGWPVDHALSASVIAPTATVADALATALLVVGPKEGMAVADGMDDVAVLLVGKDGRQFHNDRWRSVEIP